MINFFGYKKYVGINFDQLTNLGNSQKSHHFSQVWCGAFLKGQLGSPNRDM